MRFNLIIYTTFFSLGLCALSYSDSLLAILNNQIDPNDNSIGEVWFNTTGYGLADYGFDMIDDYGIYSYTSYNYLVALTNLASVAVSKGYHGDVVFLFYKFLYAGQHNSTSIDYESDMLLDIANLLSSSSGNIVKRDATSLFDILISTTSSDAVSKVYELASQVSPEK
ncbi:uncharacterized protein RJT21DRAFT_121202, partial [Scheffersomyces amazonensis]